MMGMGKEKPLTAKQLRFVELYQQSVASGKPNETQAYIDAGYTKNRASASANAVRLLADARIQQLLAPSQQDLDNIQRMPERRIEVNRERIRLEFARIAFFNAKRIFNEDGALKGIHEMTDDEVAAISSIEVEERMVGDSRVSIRTKKVKFWDKNKALEKLGDTERDFWANPKDTGGNTTFNFSVLSDDDLERLEHLVRLLAAPAPGAGHSREMRTITPILPEDCVSAV